MIKCVNRIKYFMTLDFCYISARIYEVTCNKSADYSIILLRPSLIVMTLCPQSSANFFRSVLENQCSDFVVFSVRDNLTAYRI